MSVDVKKIDLARGWALFLVFIVYRLL